MNNKKGFTLLEMVIVMGAIVVLFLLTMPNISNTMDVIDSKGCDAQIKVVDAAILQYRLKFDKIPNSTQELISANFLSERQARCSNNKVIRINNGQAYE